MRKSSKIESSSLVVSLGPSLPTGVDGGELDPPVGVGDLEAAQEGLAGGVDAARLAVAKPE
jgi:hypothetical protein